MATFDKTSGGPVGLPAHRDHVAVMQARLDFSEAGYEANDVLLVLSVPAKSFVIGVQVDVASAADASSTLSVGDFDSDGTPIAADAYLAAATSAAVGSRFSAGVGATGDNASGKYYATDAKIGVTVGGAAVTKGIVHVRVYLADLSVEYRGIGGS